ncbi:MAG TPA: hypothetical protein PKW61_00075 [Tenuifilaceae bacterium]|nr:hypothetical protein [Tenuifilaceae bacterium]
MATINKKTILDFAKNFKNSLEVLNRTMLQHNGSIIFNDLENEIEFKTKLFEEDGIYLFNGKKTNFSIQDYPRNKEVNQNDIEHSLSPKHIEMLLKALPFGIEKMKSNDPEAFGGVWIQNGMIAASNGLSIVRFTFQESFKNAIIPIGFIKQFGKFFEDSHSFIKMDGERFVIENSIVKASGKLIDTKIPNLEAVIDNPSRYTRKITIPREQILNSIKEFKLMGCTIQNLFFNLEKRICFVADVDYSIYQEWKIQISEAKFVDTTLFCGVTKNTSDSDFGLVVKSLVYENIWVSDDYRYFFAQPVPSMNFASSRNYHILPEHSFFLQKPEFPVLERKIEATPSRYFSNSEPFEEEYFDDDNELDED